MPYDIGFTVEHLDSGDLLGRWGRKSEAPRCLSDLTRPVLKVELDPRDVSE